MAFTALDELIDEIEARLPPGWGWTLRRCANGTYQASFALRPEELPPINSDDLDYFQRIDPDPRWALAFALADADKEWTTQHEVEILKENFAEWRAKNRT